jgi:hypothetical protein
VSRDPVPRPLAELSSGAAICSSAPDLTSLPRWAPALSRVPWLQALPPREVGSGTAMYPTAPSGLWTTGIKKDLVAQGTQLGSHMSKAWSHVTYALARRADMLL